MTRDEIISEIQKYNAENGKAPTKRNMDAKFVSAVRRLFGTWNEAIVASGIHVNRKYDHTESELLESLKRYSQERGKSPGANDCNACDYLFDTRTYFRKLQCKSWSEVLRKAELEEYFEKSPFIYLPDSELLLLVKGILTAENAETTSIYYKKNKGSLPSLEYLKERFGSWNSILNKIEIEPNIKKYTKEELTEFFYEAKSYFKRVPSVTEFTDYSKISIDLYKREFFTWRKFLRSIGEKPITRNSPNVTETNEELIEIYKHFSIKNGFYNGATSRVLNASDKIYSTDVFTYRFGSMNNLRVICDFETVNAYKDYQKTYWKNYKRKK